jgi:hypothetical protein
MTQAAAHDAVEPQETPGGDRVREATDDDRVAQLDEAAARRVQSHLGASDEEIATRIGELEHEWDMERVLMLNASTLALSGLAAGLRFDRRWFALPVIVLSFLVHHALRGWCPPVPLFRALGVRTRQEIDAEKSAMRALRGDYEALRTRRPAA